MKFRIYLQSASPKNSVIADRGSKRGREEYKNLNISRMKGAFFVKLKYFS